MSFLTHGPVPSAISLARLLQMGGGSNSVHQFSVLSLSLPFMHRGHRESMANFFLPLLLSLHPLTLKKSFWLISLTLRVSYYYKQRYGWKEWGQLWMSEKASILEPCETCCLNFNAVTKGVSWCILLKVGTYNYICTPGHQAFFSPAY